MLLAAALACASASGAVPRMTTTMAAIETTDPKLAAAAERRSADGESMPRQRVRTGSPAAAVTSTVAGTRVSAR